MSSLRITKAKTNDILPIAFGTQKHTSGCALCSLVTGVFQRKATTLTSFPDTGAGIQRRGCHRRGTVTSITKKRQRACAAGRRAEQARAGHAGLRRHGQPWSRWPRRPLGVLSWSQRPREREAVSRQSPHRRRSQPRALDHPERGRRRGEGG